MDPIKIIIADDHEIFRSGFKLLLKNQKEIYLAGEAENGKQLLQLVEELLPHVVIIDIQMPEMDGIEACRRIRESFPDVLVIALTTFNDDHYIVDMLQAGATGYLLKNTTRKELHKAIIAVFEGRMYYSEETFKKLSRLKAEHKISPGRITPPVKFSEREQKIIQLICKQLTNKEIASQLSISVRTVESHRERVQEKINAKNTAGIVIYALQHNLLEL